MVSVVQSRCDKLQSEKADLMEKYMEQIQTGNTWCCSLHASDNTCF
jgi:hypothetical protein